MPIRPPRSFLSRSAAVAALSAAVSVVALVPAGAGAAAGAAAGAPAAGAPAAGAPGRPAGAPPAAAGPAGAVRPVTAGRAGAAVPRLSWADCRDGFQCATATVPVDHRRPRGATLELALIRLPAADPARRIGSVFTNPGGPGSPGVAFVRATATTLFSAQVRARFDIVGVDPRGVAGSTPVRCYGSTADQQAAVRGLYDVGADAAGYRAYLARTADLARRCGERAAALLPYLTTANVARDLDLLRQAVGDRLLTYAGYSYGTYLGATYANLFPGRVRAMVLDGVVDPVGYTRRPVQGFGRLLAAGGQAAFDAFLAACRQAGDRCALAAGGRDPRRTALAVLDRLDRAPVRTPSGVVTGGLAAFTVYNALYVPTALPGLAAALAAAAAGDHAPLGRLTAAVLPPSAEYDNSTDARTANSCIDGDYPRSRRQLERTAAGFERRYLQFGRLGALLFAGPCAAWPASAAPGQRFTGPWDRPTAAPVVLLSTRYDPSTPPESARRAAARLADTRLVTVTGFGHANGYAASACARRAVDRYLIDRVPPPDRLACHQDLPAFPPAGR